MTTDSNTVGSTYIYLVKWGFDYNKYKMCEHSSVSPTAALREARRKRILENSANRLKLIEGINSSSEKICGKTSLKLEPETEVGNTLKKENSSLELKSKLSEILNNTTELKEISDNLLRNHDEEQNDNIEEEEYIETATVARKNAFFKILMQKRLHYVLLALIVNVLLFVNAGYLFSENIFCPFYSVKAIELISRREEKDFQPVLFLFLAHLPRNVQKITKITLTLLLTSLSDLCIYLFTLILGTKIINYQ